jgi:hypothetical protein
MDDENISDSSSMGQLFKSLTPVTGLVTSTKGKDVSARPALKKPFSALVPSDSTLASATVGFEQQPSAHKRRHKPTQYFGTRVGGRGSHIISSSNPTLMKHRLINVNEIPQPYSCLLV